MFTTTDTIVAIATAPGRGALGVIRLSGVEAVAIARAMMASPPAMLPRRATFARIQDADAGVSRTVDEVVVTWFEGPRSYTGEDVVEIAAHGSPVLLHRVLDLARQKGARFAEPGEFTLRAFLHGRLDLVQAEAVSDIVNAVTPVQARAAMDQLEGTLTGRIREIDSALFDLVARLEASIDFPEEGFHFVTRENAVAALGDVQRALRSLQQDGRAGRILREGGLVVISGRPNVGKSSLFNALLRADRAIVTDVAGTTRDTLTERVDVGGVPVTLVDTAGLRDAGDPIEAEGVRRARAAQAVAALTVVVLDGSIPLSGEDQTLLAECRPRLLVVNKSDLPQVWSPSMLGLGREAAIHVSTVDGSGLGSLRDEIAAALTGRDVWRDPPAVTNARHVALIEQALDAVDRVLGLLADGSTEELALAELGDARSALEEVTGRRTSDELLQHIFSSFCVGK